MLCIYQIIHFLFIQCALVVPKDGSVVEEYGENVSVDTQDGIAVVKELPILFAWQKMLAVGCSRNHLMQFSKLLKWWWIKAAIF